MKGLKTGMYYLRSRAAADAIKFTVDTTMIKVGAVDRSNSINSQQLYLHIQSNQMVGVLQDKPKVVADDDNSMMAQMVCSLTNRDECLACGS